MSRKLDEQEKSTKNLKQQIRHTKDRIQDAEYAMEHGDMSPERRKELKIKNEHRKEDMETKMDELKDDDKD